MKALLVIMILAFALTAPAKPKANHAKEMSDAAWSTFFKFRQDSYFNAMKSEGNKPVPPRAPADANEDEIKNHRAKLKNDANAMVIEEVIGLDRKPKALATYKSSIANLFVTHAKKPTTKLYSAIRLLQLESIDGRNPEGGYAIPSKASDVVVFGPTSTYEDLRERCGYPNENKPDEERCSQGWTMNSYLVGIASNLCHNSGCDKDRQFFIVTVEVTKNVYDGSNMQEGPRPKLIEPAVVQVKVTEAIETKTRPLN